MQSPHLAKGPKSSHSRFKSAQVSTILPSAPSSQLGSGGQLWVPLIEKALAKRNKARAKKMWSVADDIRNMLKEMGVLIQDTGPNTSEWRWAKGALEDSEAEEDVGEEDVSYAVKPWIARTGRGLDRFAHHLHC